MTSLVASSAPNQRANSINAIRRGLPNICPDEYPALIHDNQSAKLDPCLIDTVKKLYDQINCPKDFSAAFYTFRSKNCSAYLQKKIAELQSNAQQIGKTVGDLSAEDQQAYIFIAERLQDIVFVGTFVTSQHLSNDQHTCLSSLVLLERELHALRQKVLKEEGNHRQSLARLETIERELKELEMAMEKDQFDQMSRSMQDLARDLLS